MIIQFYKNPNTDLLLLYKKSPVLLPLMSRICKLWTDVKRAF